MDHLEPSRSSATTGTPGGGQQASKHPGRSESSRGWFESHDEHKEIDEQGHCCNSPLQRGYHGPEGENPLKNHSLNATIFMRKESEQIVTKEA